MSTEAKVGAFTLAGLALLVSAVLLLSGVSLGGSKGYALYAGFRQVVALSHSPRCVSPACPWVLCGKLSMMVAVSR